MDDLLFQIFIADNRQIVWWGMLTRGFITFFIAILIIKVGGKRIFGKQGAFDIVISIVLGTLLARAITGNSHFFPTIITAFGLALLHRTLAWLTFANKNLGKIFKGSADLLIENGILQYPMMKKHSITEKDILESIRSEGKITDINQVQEAYLERSGKISIIPKK